LVIRDGNLIVLGGEEEEQDAGPDRDVLEAILEAAQSGNLKEVQRLSHRRLAVLHGLEEDEGIRGKAQLLKALRGGPAKLKKALFRMAEGATPDNLQFLLDASHWESVGSGLHIGALSTPQNELPEVVAGESTRQASKDINAYFMASAFLSDEEPPQECWQPGTRVARDIDNIWYPAVITESPPPSPGQSPQYTITYTDDGNQEAGVEEEELRADIKASLLASLEQGIDALCSHGWPPSFIFLFDEAWELVKLLLPLAQESLGSDVSLDPGWYATKASSTARHEAPHRRHSYSQSFTADGEAKLMHFVAMLNEATVSNGNLCVVPKEYDIYFETDEAWEHMRPCDDKPEVLSLRFGIQDLRPINGLPGTVFGAAGNLIHWKSCCSQAAANPLSTLDLLFRGSDAGDCAYGFDPVGLHDAFGWSIGDRMAHVARSLLLQVISGDLAESDFPSSFSDAL